MTTEPTSGEPRLIPSNQEFSCSACWATHTEQVFISHAGRDEKLAKTIAKKSCEIGIAPYLFEFDSKSKTQSPPAEVIAKEIVASNTVFVLLSESMSKAYWTQAWVGYETGVMYGADIALYNQSYGDYMDSSYFRRKIVVAQDIHQGIKVSVPRLDALVLFDFTNEGSWEQYQNILAVVNLIDTPDFYKIGNQFRPNFMKASIKCDNDKCRNEYEAWVAIKDAANLGNNYELIAMEPRIHVKYRIQCPSCGETVTRCFEQGLQGNLT